MFISHFIFQTVNTFTYAFSIAMYLSLCVLWCSISMVVLMYLEKTAFSNIIYGRTLSCLTLLIAVLCSRTSRNCMFTNVNLSKVSFCEIKLPSWSCCNNYMYMKTWQNEQLFILNFSQFKFVCGFLQKGTCKRNITNEYNIKKQH